MSSINPIKLGIESFKPLNSLGIESALWAENQAKSKAGTGSGVA